MNLIELTRGTRPVSASVSRLLSTARPHVEITQVGRVPDRLGHSEPCALSGVPLASQLRDKAIACEPASTNGYGRIGTPGVGSAGVPGAADQGCWRRDWLWHLLAAAKLLRRRSGTAASPGHQEAVVRRARARRIRK
jgi:hypothetical protein